MHLHAQMNDGWFRAKKKWLWHSPPGNPVCRPHVQAVVQDFLNLLFPTGHFFQTRREERREGRWTLEFRHLTRSLAKERDDSAAAKLDKRTNKNKLSVQRR